MSVFSWRKESREFSKKQNKKTNNFRTNCLDFYHKDLVEEELVHVFCAGGLKLGNVSIVYRGVKSTDPPPPGFSSSSYLTS